MDFLSLVAYLKMDKSDYEKGLKDSESLASKAGSGIASVLGKTAKVAAAGIAATTTAVAGLVTASVKSYAEYEQLVGGVETLFGAGGKSLEEYAKDVGKTVSEVENEYGHLLTAQNTVMKNADNAYKTAGLSANEYMDTVTSFAASLNQSLGGNTELAAIKADQAITDMADNANKMGSSIESIQNAYQGFAKQNYTMLDNLKLGYGGTKEEMARLLEDAEKISGQKFNLSSYADVVDAIHVIQTEMGITGTTAKEATETISGSLAMTKSAWQNLVTGLTNPDADIGKLIDDMVFSATAAVGNLIPAISQALGGIVQLLKEVIPVINKELPGLIEEVLPTLLEAGISLFQGLINALPTLMQVIFDQLPTIIGAIVDAVITLLPMIIELGGEFLLALAEGLLDALPDILPKISELMHKLVEMFSDTEKLSQFLDAAVEIIMTIADGLIEALPEMIPAIIQVILGIVEMLTEPDRLIMLIEAAITLALAIAEGLLDAMPQILEAMIEIMLNLAEAIIKSIPDLLVAMWKLMLKIGETLIKYQTVIREKGIELIGKLIEGIKSMFGKIKEKGKELVDKVKEGFKEKVEAAKQWGKDLIQNFIDGVLAKWEALKQTVSNVAQTVKDFLGFSEPKLGPLSNFHTYAPDMMELFAKGITDNKQMLLDTVADAFNFEDMIVSPSLDANVTGSADNTRGYGNTFNITINQPMKSASDVARALREEAQYGLLGGGSLA